MSGLITAFHQHRADAIMSFMVLIWGLHFIVAKDALSNIEPLTFNALRFLVGLPVILPFALRQRRALRLTRRDAALVVLLTLTGPVIYQVGFSLGLKRTTSTNTALLVATMPTWTALCSIAIGMVEIRRRLLGGIFLTLGGVILVVLSRSESGLALSRSELTGSALVLGAAIASGVGSVFSKPVIDRLGGMPIAIWKYWITTVTMIFLAGPGLLSLTSAEVPTANIPNILYSGMLSGAGGFLAIHLAIREIGPTRSSSYFNFTPIIAALAGVLVLREPFSLWLLLGAALTLLGVMVVRRNIYLRRPPPVPGAAPLPRTAGR